MVEALAWQPEASESQVPRLFKGGIMIPASLGWYEDEMNSERRAPGA